jgi:hypothetical protein
MTSPFITKIVYLTFIGHLKLEMHFCMEWSFSKNNQKLHFLEWSNVMLIDEARMLIMDTDEEKSYIK